MTLQKLGLTYYGARVYQTLVSLGPSDATKLSQESEVPRTKIYDVLRRLEGEGWIDRAKHSVMLLGALYFEDKLEQMKKQLAYARKRGVNIRVITRKSIKFRGGEINPAEELASVVPEIKITGPEYSKFVITDDREVLIIYSRIEGDIPDVDSTIAIWIPNTSVASIQASMFNAIWNG